ncbi:MAG: MoaD/ThiS family protein [Stenotrophobium sp.]
MDGKNKDDLMKISVELHGVLCRLAGAQRLTVQLSGQSTVADAITAVEQLAPGMAERLEVTACAIGDALVARSAVLDPGTTLVLIPPVSGG